MTDDTPKSDPDQPHHTNHEDSDDTAIEARGIWGSIRIPLSRESITPHIKWLVFALAFGVAVLAIGGAIALVNWAL